MSIWMGSQAGGWPGGTRMNPHSKTPIVPQVKLQLDVHPPVLDISDQKPVPQKTSLKSGGGLGKHIGGSGNQWWKSLRTMYQALFSATPVTWVNPEAIGHQQPSPYQFCPQVQYQCGLQPDGFYEPSSGLWFPAQSASSQVDYMDPHVMWQENLFFPFGFEPEPFGTQLPQKVEIKKMCRPLNPEAKEWIPKEYAKGCISSPSSPRKETSDTGLLKLELPHLTNGLKEPVHGELFDFCEITDSEVDAVRLSGNGSLRSVQKGRAPQVVKEKLGTEKEGFKETDVVPVPSVMKDLFPIESSSSCGCRDIEIHICDNNVVKDSRPLSYACVVGRMSVSPPTHTPEKSLKKNSTRIEPVEQIIPKIFLKDKKYPKEKAVPSVDNENKMPGLFKPMTKNQKEHSRKFLRELREVSPVRGQDDNSMGSELDLEIPSPEPSSSPRMCSTRSPLLMESPKKSSLNDNPACPLGLPQSANLKAQRSLSESSSGSSRIRTVSDSSVTSVESLDIEFGNIDEVDRQCTALNMCLVAENNEPKCVTSPKYSNSVLALILGCDSESEESEDESKDSDSDWDDVCEETGDNILDDTWETFGLGLTIPEAGKTQKSQSPTGQDCTVGSPVKPICDTATEEDPTFTGVIMEEINKRWEQEVEKDVLGSTARKVRFGEVVTRPMIVWAHAYRTSRKGPWEMYARDRMRFSHRIAALEPVITPVLQPDHREAFYQKQQGLECCLS